MKRVIFRADANKTIGMGHVMRCLSLADAFASADCRVEFVVADDAVSGLIQDRGYRTTLLNSDYSHMDEELESWPQDLNSDYLIIDSYYVTNHYLSSLWERLRGTAEGCGKLVYIDDVLSFPYPVDILIDYNAYADETVYHKLYSDGSVDEPKFILGHRYAPLRSMFRGMPKRVQHMKVKDILISTGGSDELHLTLAIIQRLIETRGRGDRAEDRIFHFLLGAMNEDKEEIKKAASGVEWLHLHENVSDMRGLLVKMDVVVSAAGSTLYEIASCGIPLITYSLADNQVPGGQAFERLGLGAYIGDLRGQEFTESIEYTEPRESIEYTESREFTESTESAEPIEFTKPIMSGNLRNDAVEMILSSLDKLLNDYRERVRMGERMQKFIDGYGADRIVKLVLG